MLESSRLKSFFVGPILQHQERRWKIHGGVKSEDLPELVNVAAPICQEYSSLFGRRFPARRRESPGLAPVRYSRSGNRARTQELRAILRILSWPRCHRRPRT